MGELSDRDTTTGRAARRGRIAVVSQWRRDTEHGKFPIPYTHAVALAGGDPEVVSTFRLNDDAPPDIDAVDELDPSDASILHDYAGLVIPGGGDVDPAFYGAERHPRTTGINRRRDEFEFTLMAEALRLDMPVLAICHGMQALNVLMGGTLEQHLADVPDRLEHDRDRPRAEAAHQVTIAERGLLCDLFGGGEIAVNSHHHQGLDEIASPLRKVGWAGDGVLEAVESDEHTWVVGVQWHPEAMAPVDEVQLRIFERFVAACRDYAASAAPAARSA